VKDNYLHPVIGFVLFLALAGFATASSSRGEAATCSLYPQSAEQLSQDIASEITRLSSQLNSSDEDERRSAVLTLATLETPAARSLLISALGDRSERVRAAAVTALGGLEDPTLATSVAQLLLKDKSVFVRKSAAYALGRLHSQAGTPALVAALKDKNIEVRGAAAVAIGEYADEQAIEPLSHALTDKSEFVRAQSARALGVNGRAARRAIPNLIRLLTSDPDLEAKRHAAWALGEIGDPSALPALEAAQRAPDPYLSSAALTAIEKIKQQGPGKRRSRGAEEQRGRGKFISAPLHPCSAACEAHHRPYAPLLTCP
jgi:HEAT repeat protein